MPGSWGEVNALMNGMKVLMHSQLGYELRLAEKKCKTKLLQKAVVGGRVIDPAENTMESENLTDMYGSWLPPGLRDVFERMQVIAIGLMTFASLAAEGNYPGAVGVTVPLATSRNSDDFSPEQESCHLPVKKECVLCEAAEQVGVKMSGKVPRQASQTSTVQLKAVYRPQLPKDYKPPVLSMNKTTTKNRARRVPSSRIARFARFGQLGVGLAAGAAAEIVRRTFAFKSIAGDSSNTTNRIFGTGNPFLTSTNAEKIVQTMCRVRGAALKLGQMLSIQDSELISPNLLQIFERVRDSADFMPTGQLRRQLRRDLGSKWRSHFLTFEDKPFAAASIGQVHRGTLLDGRRVAVKIQYPGVAEGIDSDIDNLVTVLNVGSIFPKGLYLENFVKVARRELKLECDYRREARAMKKFSELLQNDQHFYVPEVVDELTTARVLTAEYVEGIPVDKCMSEPQAVRDYIAGKFIELCLKEVFVWRFMQTDPNWSNFLFGRHPVTNEPRLILLDFGASRSYPKKFVDQYMHIIRAAYDNDQEKIIKYSKEIGFLTGFESKIMEKAHCDSISILGETLASSVPYDFSKQDITRRIHNLIPVMLENRLTAPPEEVYSLHRKLSGSYLLAAKLRAVVSCGPLFEAIHKSYTFGENGFCDVDIDTDPQEADTQHSS